MKNSFESLKFSLGPLLFTILVIFFDLDPGNPKVTYTAGIALWMAVWWITEIIPLAVTALIPIVCFPLLGIMGGKEVSPLYFNHVIFLFIGGFIMALAMEKWELHKRIAIKVLTLVGTKPSGILFGFMISTAFLSMWISNTATAMMMLPIAMAVIKHLEHDMNDVQLKSFVTGILLSIAYSASLGGIATLVGTPPNLAFARIFTLSFPEAPEISFAQWMFLALPISIIFLIIVWALLRFMYFKEISFNTISIDLFKTEYKKLGPFTKEQTYVLSLFILLVFLWLFRADINLGSFSIPGWSGLFNMPNFINDGTVAIFVAILLFIFPDSSKQGTRLMDWQTASRLPWNMVLLFGGGFALARGFKTSGLSKWIGNNLALLEGVDIVLLILVIVTLLVFLTELTSNTGSVEIFLPILAAIGVQLEVNPLILMVPATIACSFAFMLPVATPPNAIVFGTDRVKIQDMAKTGLWLNIAGIILITAMIFVIGQFVLGIDLSIFPDWATH